MHRGSGTDRPRASSARGGPDRRPRRVHRRREPAEQLDSLHVAQPAQPHHLPARLRLLPEALRDHAAAAADRIRGPAEDHGEATRGLRVAPADNARRTDLCSPTSESFSGARETDTALHSLANSRSVELALPPLYGEKREGTASMRHSGPGSPQPSLSCFFLRS